VRPTRPVLRHVAGALISASIATGISTIAVRAASGGSPTVRLLEGATLLLAAVAYLFYEMGKSARGLHASSLVSVAIAAATASGHRRRSPPSAIGTAGSSRLRTRGAAPS
jgi:hypothetical protein